MVIPRSIPSRRGVTLVDALIGSVLLGVALAVLLGIGTRAIGAQARGEDLRNAAAIIDEQLNLIVARGPDNYGSRFDTVGIADPPFQKYRYQVEFSGGQGGNAYEVTVTVTWNSGSGERRESVTTLIAPRLGDEPDPIRKPDEAVSRWY